ncbi:MAG: LLM class flavin-dependent oxidoreductase [Defluviimonas denitrificans]
MRFYTTCPPSTAYDAQSYPARVSQVARWSEAAGAEGALIYTDNSLVDPWTVAQMMLMETKRFIPMIATQPVYMPPFSVAKRIASLALLTGRKVALNMVAGGFPATFRRSVTIRPMTTAMPGLRSTATSSRPCCAARRSRSAAVSFGSTISG